MEIVEKYFTVQKYYLTVQTVGENAVTIYFHKTFSNTNFSMSEFRQFILIDVIMFHARRLMKDHQISFTEYEPIANLLKKKSNYFYLKNTYLSIDIHPLFEELMGKDTKTEYDSFLRNLFLIYSQFFNLQLKEQIYQKYENIFAKERKFDVAMKMVEEIN